ncbi:MAG: hypothetical protein ACI92O_000427 [Colwellia sp.]
MEETDNSTSQKAKIMNTQQTNEVVSIQLMTKAELMLINQENTLLLNLEKIHKTLKNKPAMSKMSRFSENKMRVDFERATSKLEKIRLIKTKYNSEKPNV